MTIKQKRKSRKLQIDLSGPAGNAFNLLGLAQQLMTQLCYTPARREEVMKSMKSSDYEHLLQTMDKELGELIDFYR
jgi:hypothetical protein